MNFDLETFQKFDFAGSQITAHNIWQSQKPPSEFNLQGSFQKKQYEGCRFWSLWFKRSEDADGMNTADLTGKIINHLDICPEEESILVRMSVGTDSDKKEIVFRCQGVRPHYYRYEGMSYRNLYDTEEYQKRIDRQRYVLDKQYLAETEEVALPGGYSIEAAIYKDADEHTYRAFLQKCILKKSGKAIYEYLCTYDHGVRFRDFILHSNGRRYFPFHVDLYGICYLDVDSLETFHYVPEGYAHDFEYSCGESFIVTDIHYDNNTDLIAYGGCYWAWPSGVMVGDFSEPLNFDPRLFDIGNIVDPDREGYDILFRRWEDTQLVVTVEGEEQKIPVEEIIGEIR